MAEYHNKFYAVGFWDEFYKDKEEQSVDWYFDLTKLKMDEFSFSMFPIDSAILLLGPGISSTLPYLDNKGYSSVDVLDFSNTLIEILKKKYSKNEEWSFTQENIASLSKEISEDLDEVYDYVIDKGCIDCILSDPEDSEKKFKDALNNIIKGLKPGGKFYYFSYAKIGDRINMFYDIPKIKFKCHEITANMLPKDDTKYYNEEDNCYSLFIIEKQGEPKEDESDEEEDDE